MLSRPRGGAKGRGRKGTRARPRAAARLPGAERAGQGGDMDRAAGLNGFPPADPSGVAAVLADPDRLDAAARMLSRMDALRAAVEWALEQVGRTTLAQMALFSVVDPRRHVVLAAHGRTGGMALPTVFSPAHSICRYVIASAAGMVVGTEDARADAVLSATLAVREMGVVGYLGSRVCDGAGRPVAALCLASCERRGWGPEDADALSGAVELIEAEIARGAALAENIFALC